jgi:hypothetical protein
MTNQQNPQSLDVLASGRSNSDPFITFFSDRDPTPNDINYPIQKRWFNTVENNEWILVSFTSFNALLQANWQPVSQSSADLLFLSGNTGGMVPGDAFSNINVFGDTTTINVVGNPVTHTLTISTTDTVATTYTADTGTATPSGGNLNLFGAGSITTTASGSTVTTELFGLTQHSLLLGGASPNTIVNLGVATDGQLPIGSTGANPVLGHITSTGGSIAVTNGPGTINVETVSRTGQVSFFAVLSVTQNNVLGPFGVFYTFNGTNVVQNIGGGYNPGTGVFTAPVTGVYQFTGNIVWSGINNTHVNAVVFVGSSPFYFDPFNVSRNDSNLLGLSFTGNLFMNASDTTIFNMSVSNGPQIINAEAGMTFSGFLLN